MVNNLDGTATVTITGSTSGSSNAVKTAPYTAGELTFTTQDTVAGDGSSIVTLSNDVYVFLVDSTKDSLQSRSNIIIATVTTTPTTTMTDELVVMSFLNWASTNHSGDADWGDPTKFDAESDDLSSWVEFRVKTLNGTARRRNAPRHLTLQVSVLCWYRAQTNPIGDTTLASSIRNLLEHQIIAVSNFDEAGNPAVGYITLNEGRIKDESEKLGRAGWRVSVVEVDGRVEALP